MISKIDHFVITTANLSACIQFYKTLGFHTLDAGSHWELYSGDFKINVHIKHQELEPKARFVQTGSADVCFELDCTMEDCIKTLTSNKIVIELGIVTRYGVKGEMKSIYVRDPDGNLIELSTYG